MHVRRFDVYECEPLFVQIVILLLHLIYKKIYSLPLFISKGNHGPHHAWVTQTSLSPCLPYSCSSLLKQLCVSFIYSYFWSPSCWSCSCYFSKLVFLMFSKLMFLMFFQILVVFLSSHSWCSSKLAFLMLSKLAFLLLFLDTFLLFFSIVFLLLQVHNKSICCSKFTTRVFVAPSSQQEYLLLQVHILIILLGGVLVVPSF